MKAQVGDHIVLAGNRLDLPVRDGEVLEVRGPNGGPPYLVRWADTGKEALLFPGPDAHAQHQAEAAEAARTTPAPTVPAQVSTAGPAQGSEADVPRHVRTWQVRISAFGSDDDTSATAVLLSDSPHHLTGRGTAHRSPEDNAVPEIGDEIAAARALRHLADRLLEAAGQDVSQMTGENVHLRR